MSHRSLRLAALLVAPIALFALASPAHAQKKQAADPKAKCQDMVRKKVKGSHEYAQKIDVAQTRDFQESSKVSGYGGTATVVTHQNKTVEYEWTCTYDPQKGKVLKVNVQKTKGQK